jgi:hypothetical protein
MISEQIEKLEQVLTDLHNVDIAVDRKLEIEKLLRISSLSVFEAIGKLIKSNEYAKELNKSRYDTEIENKIDYEQENK